MASTANAWNRTRFTLYAPIYDFAGAVFARQRRRSAELLDLRPGESLLINGAGTGLDFPFVPSGVRITATDIAPAMVARMRKRGERLGRPIDAVVMDIERLDFADNTFDAAMLHLILAVTDDPLRGIRETARVVRPGGRIAIFDKFLPDGTDPSWYRRLGGAVTRMLFSDINRQAGPLLAAAALRPLHDEHALAGGLFRILLATKPEQPEAALHA